MLKKLFLSTIFTMIITILSCSDDDSCGQTLITFNNKTDYTIYLQVYGQTDGYQSIAPGSSYTLFDLMPGNDYGYNIINGAGDIISSGTETAEDCVSLGIDFG